MSEFKVIARLLGKFTFQELNLVINDVMDIDMKHVVDVILEFRLGLRAKHVVQALLYICEGKNLSKEELKELIKKLTFYEVIRKYKLLWKGVKLENQIDEFPHVDVWEEKIEHVFKCDDKDCDILIFEDEPSPLIYVMCTEKHKTKKGLKCFPPFYFVIHKNLAEQYIFYTSTSQRKLHVQLNLICKALGYDGYSPVSENGLDVRNMFMIIDRKQRNVTLEIPDFDPVRLVFEDVVVDFTLGVERSNYAQQVFPGVSNTNTFNVHANSSWKGSDTDSDDGDDKVFTSLTFKTKRGNSVEKAFQELVKAGLVQFPLPRWMINFKNTLTSEVSLRESHSDDSH